MLKEVKNKGGFAMVDNIITEMKNIADNIENVTQVDYYEGQFEDLDSFIINPPAILIELPEGVSNSKIADYFSQTVRLYLVTSSMKGLSNTSMYPFIDTVRNAFHNKAFKADNQIYSYVKSWSRLGIFPGFCVYEMLISVEV